MHWSPGKTVNSTRNLLLSKVSVIASLKAVGVVGAILIGGAILIICVSNFRNRRN